MQVQDVFVQNRGLWLRLNEKGGKRHDGPRHHALGLAQVCPITGAGTPIRPEPPGTVARTGCGGRLLQGDGCGYVAGAPWEYGRRWIQA